MTIIDIAQVCHEANKAFCEVLGDFSQELWGNAEKWQKDSAIKGVEFVIANPEASASAQHDAWMKDKIEDGWSFGVVKDVINKRHPYLVSFEDLSFEQQAKDVLFKAICVSLLPLKRSD